MKLSRESERWLNNFRDSYGRAPRILHIGNIANNAYNNAKLLNVAGLDCDVICYDYYHTMSCPEWEDADFIGEINDELRPDWTKVDLRGFVRPDWFAQGKMGTCIKYLLARRTEGQSHQNRYEENWKKLQLENLSANPTEDYSVASNNLAVLSVKLRTIGRLVEVKFVLMLESIFRFAVRKLRAILIRLDKCETKILDGSSMLPKALLFFLKVAILPVYLMRRSYRRIRSWKLKKAVDNSFENRVSFLVKMFHREFAERKDQLQSADLVPYQSYSKQWQQLLACYDYVIGYSTDPIIPLVSNVPYFAFEHGTLRTIPYNDSAQGRLTSIAYRMAQHVFVTNFDCVASAEKLAHGRFTVINHPYDENHGMTVLGWEQTRRNLLHELDSDFLFFHPTRHDWVEGTGHADKGNDVFLRAFCSLRDSGARVGLVCCSWGSNVEESKALLDDRGCESYVRWVAPLAIIPFERMCLGADIVVDQFKLGAFGGVVFKAMAVGTPILTYLDESLLSRQYSEQPPVVNCRTAEEIVEKMKTIIASSEQLADIANDSREWMIRFHSKQTTVNKQIDQFRLQPLIGLTLNTK